jgi:hypothetical protein
VDQVLTNLLSNAEVQPEGGDGAGGAVDEHVSVGISTRDRDSG